MLGRCFYVPASAMHFTTEASLRPEGMGALSNSQR